MVELAKKVYLFIFVTFICQKLLAHNGAGGNFGFTHLEKNARIFARDTGAKYFLKGSRKSNQSSKHLSQKGVMKISFFTLLLGHCQFLTGINRYPAHLASFSYVLLAVFYTPRKKTTSLILNGNNRLSVLFSPDTTEQNCL